MLGLPAVREYPFGVPGEGDVDSGPVLFGMGGAANIVGVGAYLNNGEKELSSNLRNEVEGLGFAQHFGTKKRYFFGAIPMADAFIAWTNSFQIEPDLPRDASYSGLLFHLVSLLIVAVFYGIWRYLTS